MHDKQKSKAKRGLFWHLVICCGPIIILGLIGAKTVMPLAGFGRFPLLVGAFFLVLIGILLYRIASRSESEDAYESSDPDTRQRKK
jgi:hypothetical protein